MIRWSKTLAIDLVVYSTAAIALMFASGRVGVVADDRDEVEAEVLGGWVEVVEETMQPSAVGVWGR